jgi:hypothetical protein
MIKEIGYFIWMFSAVTILTVVVLNYLDKKSKGE